MNKYDIVEIIPHLYISNWDTSNNKDAIIKYNINAVITLETRPKPNDILNFYKLYGTDYIYINIGDDPNENIYNYFNFTYDFIKKYIKQHKNILVHCYAGISRSATIILNYIIKDQYLNNLNIYKEKPEDVVQHVLSYTRTKRHFINPNNGFLNQLVYAANNYRNNKFTL
jgi:protein-tyrosine phosphatase